MSNSERNGSQYQQYEQTQQHQSSSTMSANSQSYSQQTPSSNHNETIDVFEYEPTGFMSRGRW